MGWSPDFWLQSYMGPLAPRLGPGQGHIREGPQGSVQLLTYIRNKTCSDVEAV